MDVTAGDETRQGAVNDREAERLLAARDAALADRDGDPTTDASGVPHVCDRPHPKHLLTRCRQPRGHDGRHTDGDDEWHDVGWHVDGTRPFHADWG